jgi:hypothetical protein
MPYPSSYVADPGNIPVEYNSVAAADTAIAVIATYYDAATLGTLPPGIYLVSWGVYILNGAIAAAFANTKLMVGGVVWPAGTTEGSVILSGEIYLDGAVIIEITAAAGAIVKVQATMSQLGTIKFTGANGGGLTNMTYIYAMRIK